MTTPHYPTPASMPVQSAPPLWAPYYGAPFKEAIQRVFKKYATFSGRASRSEYWWWALAAFIVSLILQILTTSGNVTTTDAAGNISTAPGPLAVIGSVLQIVWGLGTIVPSLALLARRLHDVNLSAWLILVGLVPFLGILALLVMAILPSNPQGQRFDRPSAGPAFPAGQVYGG